MALFAYLQQVQRFLKDSRQQLLDPADIIGYVNRARREVAMRSQSIRQLTPISGSIRNATITAAGSGYSSLATVSISPPDFPSGQLPFPNGDQATGTCTVTNGSITDVQIGYGGFGYFAPTASITDSTGTGATISLGLSFINELSRAQEVYPFSAVDLSLFPGVGSILAVKSVSIIYANYRYSLPCYSFSTYQAMIRQYPFQYQYVPAVCAQFGQGAGGSFYMYPIPSQTYQMEWDCICLPSDLTADADYEAIPQPWDDAVAYFAAHLAFLELQNANSARLYLDLFDRQMHIYSASARPGRVTNPYGRW